MTGIPRYEEAIFLLLRAIYIKNPEEAYRQCQRVCWLMPIDLRLEVLPMMGYYPPHKERINLKGGTL